jgi:tRNA threonylcarbamoyladenosine biosynthesis protein TsaE
LKPRESARTDAPEATEAAGEHLADRLDAGDVVLLEGDLAAGKTTFVRGLVRGLGGDDDAVSSPSFVLLQSYDCGARGVSVLHHVDLYRLGDRIADLRELGLEEVLSDPDAVVAVEWPKDAIATWIPSDARTWRVAITTNADGSRAITIHSPNPPNS